MIKNAFVISKLFLKVFADEGTFSVRLSEEIMETVDWRLQKLRFQQTEETLRGCLLVVTAVICQLNSMTINMVKIS